MKQFCVNLVIYKDHTRMQSHQNVKFHLLFGWLP